MNYKEYRKAGDRHLKTCKLLMEKISLVPAIDQKKILLNVYYLSGYVIETSLSYAFFSQIKYKGDVENCSLYKDFILGHRFETKINFIKKNNGNLNDLPFVNQKHDNKYLNLLFHNWSTDFRYSHNEKIKQEIIEINTINLFLKEIEKIHYQINVKY